MPTFDNFRTYRDPVLSLWQSAVQEVSSGLHARVEASGGHPPPDLMAPVHTIGEPLSSGQNPPDAITAPTPAAAPHAAGIGGIVADCATAAAKFLWAEIKGDEASSTIYAGILKDSECDAIGWSECLTKYLEFKASGDKFPYRPNCNPEFTLPDNAKIAIIGDWGTGESAAIHLLQQVASFSPDILLHLGDIYFAGTQNEANSNFLGICRSVLPKATLYSLCGNHDMYSGGTGYYWLLDQIGQHASYFSLKNDYWLFQAMDTGFHDHQPLTVNTNMTRLYDKDGWNEADWHLGKIAGAAGRRIALFSHHQLYSAFGSVGNDENGNPSAFNPNLLGDFKAVLPKVGIWFWGHEHTLAIYDPYLGLSRGRCVGASAIPVFTNQQSYDVDNTLFTPSAKAPTWDAGSQLGNSDSCYNNAFAIMTLNGADAATVEYYQVPLGGAWVKAPFVDSI